VLSFYWDSVKAAERKIGGSDHASNGLQRVEHRLRRLWRRPSPPTHRRAGFWVLVLAQAGSDALAPFTRYTFDIRNLDHLDLLDTKDHVHSVADLTVHVSALFDHLGIEPAHVLGTSLGGFVA